MRQLVECAEKPTECPRCGHWPVAEILYGRVQFTPELLGKSCSWNWTPLSAGLANPNRGDVWIVDLGMVARSRPCLVLSIPPNQETDRVLVTVVAHTASPRGSPQVSAKATTQRKSGSIGC